MVKRHFLDHPRSVGESYGEHMGSALFFARHMLVGGMACLVHAFFPSLCVRTGSRTVAALHDRMVTNRHRGMSPRGGDAGAGAGAGPCVRQ